MASRRRPVVVACAVACAIACAIGCGSSSSDGGAPPTDSSPQETETAQIGCAPGELQAADGHCEPAGIPASKCGKGFASNDQHSCDVVLPSDACPAGKMAIPGETTCRDVASCGTGTWGDIPVDATTQYVDASFTGTSDGSKSAPWTTIGKGIASAASGAIVAVAAGSYAEDVVVGGAVLGNKSVEIWGRCPSMVEIVGTASSKMSVFVKNGVSSTGLHTLAVRGVGIGISVSGSKDIVLDRLWIHDTGERGLDVENGLGNTTVTLTGSLVENTRYVGAYSGGSVLTIESSVVRGTLGRSGDLKLGRGIAVTGEDATRGTLTVHATIVSQSHDSGIYVEGSDATIEESLVADTQPAADGTQGRGINAQIFGDQRATVVLRASNVERNFEIGVGAFGSDLTIEDSVVRDTAPRASDQTSGHGVQAQRTSQRSSVTLRESVVERSHRLGVFIGGSDATIEGTIVRDTEPQASDQQFGHGINVQADPATLDPSTATIDGSLVDNSYSVGVLVSIATLVADHLYVRNTKARPADKQFGDGVCLGGSTLAASAQITNSRVEASARAGISTFGGAVTLGTTTFECDAIPLDGETLGSTNASFDDRGGNVCGCGGTSSVCQVLGSGLAPPESIGP
jgi:hypothetical protein